MCEDLAIHSEKDDDLASYFSSIREHLNDPNWETDKDSYEWQNMEESAQFHVVDEGYFIDISHDDSYPPPMPPHHHLL